MIKMRLIIVLLHSAGLEEAMLARLSQIKYFQ